MTEIDDLVSAIDTGRRPLDVDSFFRLEPGLADRGGALQELGISSKLNYQYIGKKGVSDFARYGNDFEYAARAVSYATYDLASDSATIRARMPGRNTGTIDYKSPGHTYAKTEYCPQTSYDLREAIGTRPSIFLTASGYNGSVPDYQYGQSRESMEEAYNPVRLHP